MKFSLEQQQAVQQAKAMLEAEGWRVVLLNNKSPDAIAVKDGKVIALEALGYYRIVDKKKGHLKVRGWTKTQKLQAYQAFDDVHFIEFEHPPHASQRPGDNSTKLTEPVSSGL